MIVCVCFCFCFVVLIFLCDVSDEIWVRKEKVLGFLVFDVINCIFCVDGVCVFEMMCVM